MKTTHVFLLLMLILVGGLLYFAFVSPNIKSEDQVAYDEFAQCLADAGAKFYGAFWCPHCQEQEELLKHSDKLPYVECSTPDGNAQTQVCIDAGITGYPTWKFADGSETSGVQTIAALSEKTGCVAP